MQCLCKATDVHMLAHTVGRLSQFYNIPWPGATRAALRKYVPSETAPAEKQRYRERARSTRKHHVYLAKARKKAQRKQQETTLVPHRTPNLSMLQEEPRVVIQHKLFEPILMLKAQLVHLRIAQGSQV
jgi:hypothetical protein